MPSVLVYGCNGALGSVIVEQLKNKNYHVIGIDFAESKIADVTILGDMKAETLSQQAETILSQAAKIIKDDQKLEAVISAAGGWAGGDANSEDFLKNVDLTAKQSVWSSAIAAKLAALYLKGSNGLLVLPGAAAAGEDNFAGTPAMIAYGMHKAAVHQLVKSLAMEGSGLPNNTGVYGTLPVMIDTPMNRKFAAADTDFGTWTKREFISESIIGWMEQVEKRPQNGSLVKFVTKNYENFVTYH